MATPTGASSTVGASFSHGDGAPETEKNVGEPENTYILRPVFQQRFRPSVVKDCIHAVLKEELANAEYSPEEMPQLTKHLSENIKDKLKEMGFDRYKMVVQVVIGEQRGEGVFMAARCFWDADTDNYIHDVFMNLILCRSGIWLFLLLNLLKIWEKDTTMKKSELFNIVKYLDKIKISCQFGN
ncbi:dynein light chain Tctex-type protein 2B isoform X3 [Nycticebus coucang]|uniref:dynein light chain Tctex-type protein 2B isoform X3 n=1 Tax=Nycticebus coucang TaxID=9470 RepID=UPI00234C33DB|nr:dynein light chain Tctex-type protein 2B isoform X3 [Nycticebus coucang]